jgi:hypothetical protein
VSAASHQPASQRCRTGNLGLRQTVLYRVPDTAQATKKRDSEQQTHIPHGCRQSSDIFYFSSFLIVFDTSFPLSFSFRFDIK